jgi:hypothetical protein
MPLVEWYLTLKRFPVANRRALPYLGGNRRRLA